MSSAAHDQTYVTGDKGIETNRDSGTLFDAVDHISNSEGKTDEENLPGFESSLVEFHDINRKRKEQPKEEILQSNNQIINQKRQKIISLEEDKNQLYQRKEAVDHDLTQERQKNQALEPDPTEERQKNQALEHDLTQERQKNQALEHDLTQERQKNQAQGYYLTQERHHRQVLGQYLTLERHFKQATEYTLMQERHHQQATENYLSQERHHSQALERDLTQERQQKEALEQDLTQERQKKEALEQDLTKVTQEKKQETECLRRENLNLYFENIALGEKISSDKQTRECKICLSNEAKILYKPCNHIPACQDCFKLLQDHNYDNCPICRSVTDDIINLHYS